MTPFKSIILVIFGIAGILWVIANRWRVKKGPIPTALCHLPMVLTVISGIMGLIDPAFSIFGRFSALAQHYSHVINGIIMGMVICLMPYLMRLRKWGGEEQPKKES